MEKQLALMFILGFQPIVAWLLWLSMAALAGHFGLIGTSRTVIVLAATVSLYAVFSFFFARGFLNSSEAKKLGF